MTDENYEESDHEYDETDETSPEVEEDVYDDAGVEELEEDGEADAAGFMRGYNEAAEEKPKDSDNTEEEQ